VQDDWRGRKLTLNIGLPMSHTPLIEAHGQGCNMALSTNPALVAWLQRGQQGSNHKTAAYRSPSMTFSPASLCARPHSPYRAARRLRIATSARAGNSQHRTVTCQHTHYTTHRDVVNRLRVASSRG